MNDPIFASFDTAPSPHRRINAPSLLLAFAHTQGEAGTPSGGVGSAVVGRNNSPVLCAGGVHFPCKKMTPPIFASFDTAPSPHRRINAPSLLLAFAHIHGEAGTPTGGVGSAVVGRNSPVLFVQEGCFSWIQSMTPFSPHLTPPRLRTGESMHLVCFWPSPTSRARRERQRGASGVRWWVGTARFCVQEGCFFVYIQ
jgi:hypothetical protein